MCWMLNAGKIVSLKDLCVRCASWNCSVSSTQTTTTRKGEAYGRRRSARSSEELRALWSSASTASTQARLAPESDVYTRPRIQCPVSLISKTSISDAPSPFLAFLRSLRSLASAALVLNSPLPSSYPLELSLMHSAHAAHLSSLAVATRAALHPPCSGSEH